MSQPQKYRRAERLRVQTVGKIIVDFSIGMGEEVEKGEKKEFKSIPK